MEAFIGQITPFAGNFAPRGWAFCDGALISVNSNPSLFAIIGTIYGGDGVNNFALPDLRSRAVLGAGNGPGLPATKPGLQQTVMQGTGQEAQFGTLGMNYIICLEGVFPTRN
ncbi:MAG: tail fiber protein [Acidobacteriota bacterium]